jgi:Flp pilus assembly CpaE family ATPase
MVLAGIERPESRYRVSAELPTAAVTTLRGLFEDIVVDVGEVVGGVSSSTTDAVLRSADRVLLVTGADLVGIWNARSAVRHLREGLGIAEEAVGVVLNRREGREHYAAREVERALGLPVFGVVREDRRAARRAIEQQVPITAVRGRAPRELRALASRLAIAAPAAAPSRKRRWLRPLNRSLAERT